MKKIVGGCVLVLFVGGLIGSFSLPKEEVKAEQKSIVKRSVAVRSDCPRCPKRRVKVARYSPKKDAKRVMPHTGKGKRLVPPALSTPTPYPQPASFILKEFGELTTPEGERMRLLTPEMLTPTPDIP